MSKGYYYNTPNHGRQVLHAAQALDGAWVASWDGGAAIYRLNTTHLPACRGPHAQGECQRNLDAFAKARGLEAAP